VVLCWSDHLVLCWSDLTCRSLFQAEHTVVKHHSGGGGGGHEPGHLNDIQVVMHCLIR
jgi:hypothetical protein